MEPPRLNLTGPSRPTFHFVTPAVAALLCTVASLAVAQPGSQWLVVPALVADGGDVSPLSRRTAEVLEARLPSGQLTIIPARQARARFEQRGSSAPMLATHSDLDALARDAQQALYHVASGLPTRARQDVERALARAGNVIESLNRETRAAQHLLDACLYLVRAQLEGGQREEAREQALQCRRLVPDIEPDGTMHPPDVIGVLAEAEAHLRQREPGSLRVESTPAGCAVFVNGRMLGTSPLELPDLSPGEYRVQVECREGQPGRVHRTVMAAGRVVKRIDTGFDAMLQTAIDVSLQYSGYPEQDRFATDHATEIGRVVGASDVVLVSQQAPSVEASGVMLVRRIQVADGKLIAAVKIAMNDAGEVGFGRQAQALSDLQEGRFSDLSQDAITELAVADYEVEPRSAELSPRAAEAPVTAEPLAVSVEMDAEADHGAASNAALSGGTSVFGWVLGAAGATTAVVGWSLYGYQLTLETDYREAAVGTTEYFSALNDLDSFQFTPLVTTFAGMALLSASLPWILPDDHGVPGWSLATGAAGVILAGVGGYFLYAGATCDEFDRASRCTDASSTTYLGGMFLLTAAPLLTIPIVYLTRGAGGSSQVSVQATASGIGVEWDGVL